MNRLSIKLLSVFFIFRSWSSPASNTHADFFRVPAEKNTWNYKIGLFSQLRHIPMEWNHNVLEDLWACREHNNIWIYAWHVGSCLLVLAHKPPAACSAGNLVPWALGVMCDSSPTNCVESNCKGSADCTTMLIVFYLGLNCISLSLPTNFL